MEKCPFCHSEDIHRSRNDSGHFKTETIRIQPIRIYQYRCNGCGFVASFAKEDKR